MSKAKDKAAKTKIKSDVVICHPASPGVSNPKIESFLTARLFTGMTLQ
ncbi:MAG: hypothetical protein JRN15_22540 [Nitrososphaerota archaeon]|nr:hypothetical protein [Nitrososphaerota archaeon]